MIVTMEISKTVKYIMVQALVFCLLMFSGDIRLSSQSRKSYDELSRNMEQAIRFYHNGQDNDAMDRFMDILVKGTPSEKSLANEYISKITLRMSSGVSYPGNSSSKSSAAPEPAGDSDSVKNYSDTQAPPVPLGMKQVDSYEAHNSEERKELINKRIEAKIAEIRNSVLLKLNRSGAVKICMEKNTPKAIALNSEYLFSKGTAFKDGSTQILSDIAGLLFAMEKTHCLILPEGAIDGDAKVINIRRALALNSYLTERGISPSRLDVNLIGSDIDLPSNLRDISGLVIIFNDDTAFNLEPSKKSDNKGPQISLGIFPTSIATYENEGAIIEFSVFKTPFGSPTWKFQIFQLRNDKSMFLVREINGHGEQYHQSFWNGKKDFFGEAYPSGQYVFSLRAANAEGKESVMRKLLLLKEGQGKKTSVKVKSKSISPKPAEEKAKPKKENRYAFQKSKTRGESYKNRPKAALKSGGKPESSSQISDTLNKKAIEKQTEFISHVSYKIYFKSGSNTITSNSRKKLLQVADTMNYYPTARIELIGYAYSGEPNSEAMAQSRANFVVSQLSEKYGIKKSRIDATTRIAEVPKSIVEIKMLGNN
ncbi:MAG: OmpA family protein [Elusimicrobia bacterium]|nr:OmpA family protein [Elusimicrobiota bacterium]